MFISGVFFSAFYFNYQFVFRFVHYPVRSSITCHINISSDTSTHTHTYTPNKLIKINNIENFSRKKLRVTFSSIFLWIQLIQSLFRLFGSIVPLAHIYIHIFFQTFPKLFRKTNYKFSTNFGCAIFIKRTATCTKEGSVREWTIERASLLQPSSSLSISSARINNTRQIRKCTTTIAINTMKQYFTASQQNKPYNYD